MSRAEWSNNYESSNSKRWWIYWVAHEKMILCRDMGIRREAQVSHDVKEHCECSNDDAPEHGLGLE